MAAINVYGVVLGNKFRSPDGDKLVTVVEFLTPSSAAGEWQALLDSGDTVTVKELKRDYTLERP